MNLFRNFVLRSTLALSIFGFGLLPARADWSDVTYWKNNAGSDNLNADNWYNSTKGWDNHNPNYEGGRDLVFDSANRTSLNNNFTGTGAGRWRLRFVSGANSTITISGSTENTFYDSGGNIPKIENSVSNVKHVVSFPIKIGYSGGLELNPINGDLDVNGAINNNSYNILVYGPNQKVLTLGGVVSGTGKLMVKENSTVKISAASTFTGDTEIDQGVVEITGSGNLGSANIYIGHGGNSANAKFTLSGTTASFTNKIVANTSSGSGTRTIEKSGSTAQTISGTVTLNRGMTVDLLGTGGLTLSGVISGANALTKSGTGTGALTLSAANSFSGGLTISAGTVNLNNATAPGSGTLTIAGGTIDNTTAGSVTLSNNNAQSWNGDFTFTGTQALNMGTGSVTMNASRTVTVSGSTLTVGGGISGNTFNITKAGTGALVLNGNITTTSGNVTVNANSGTLTLAGANTFTGGVTLNSGSMLNINSTTALGGSTGTFTISGGTIDNTSAGDITLANNNAQNWNGDFTYTGGSRSLNLGTGAVTMNANRQVTVSGNTLTVGGAVGESGGARALTKAGNGTLVLSGNNTYTGGTTVSAGTLQIGAGSTTGSISGNIANSGTVAFNRSDNISYSSVISGTGGLTMSGGGKLTLTGANSYSGTTTVSAGTLEVGSGGTAGTINNTAVSLGNGANITFNRSDDITHSGTISGAGGNLTKQGGGKLTITGSHSYSGATTVSAGLLTFNGTNTSTAVTIGNNAKLGGSGSLGATTVQSGGRLAPGNSPGNLTVSSLTLEAGSGYDWEIDNVSGTAGTNWDLVTVGGGTGTVTINANSGSPHTVYISGAGTGFSDTTSYSWRIIDAGTLTGFAANAFAVNFTTLGGVTPTGSFSFTNSSGDLLLNYTGASGSYDLTVAASTTQTQSEASGGATQLTGAKSLTKLGAGTLTLTNSANDYTGVTTVKAGTLQINVAAPNNSAGALGTAASAVILGDTASASNAVFNFGAAVDNARGISVAAGTGTADRVISTTIGSGTATQSGTVTANTNIIFSAASGGTLLVSGVISQGGALTISNSGTVAFTGINTYTNTTTIQNGSTLRAGNNSALGTTDGNTVVNSGGVLQLSNAITSSEALNLTGTGISNSGALQNVSGANTVSGAVTLAGTTRINADTGTTLTLSGGVTGAGQSLTLGGAGNISISTSGINTSTSGALTIDSTGVVTITASGNYTGTTTLSSGTARLGNASAFGTSGLNLNGGTLASDSGTGRTIANNVTMGGNIILGEAATGTGDLTLSGTVALGATRSFTVNNTASTLSGIVSGSGFGITKLGTGSLTLSGVNTYSGTTTITAGKIIIGNNSGLGSGTVALNGGALETDSTARTIANPMSLDASSTIAGTGALTVNGTTTVTLSAGLTNNSVGGLTLGNLTLGNNGTARTLELRGTGNTTINGVVANSSTPNTGTLDIYSTGVTALNGANTYSGTTTVRSGATAKLGNASALGSTAAGTTVVSGGVLDLNGQTVGAEALSIGGTGISTGGALINSSANAASLSGAVTLTAATTITTSSGDLTLSGAVGESGSRALTKAGTGKLTLSGANTFSGGVTLSAGTLSIGNNAAFGTGQVDFADNVAIQTADSTDRTVTNNISLRNLTVGGTGALTLSGSITNVGTSIALTNNNSGGLTLGNIDLSASGTSRTLTIVGTGNTTVTGVIANGSTATASAVTLNASGTTLTLSGANTYGGATTITAGTLVAANGTALGNTTGATTVADGAALAFSNNVNSAEAITISGTGVGSTGSLRSVSGSNTNTGTVSLGASSTIKVDSGSTLQLGTIDTSTGTRNLTVNVDGTLLVTGALLNSTSITNVLQKDGTGNMIVSNNGTTGGLQLQVGNGSFTLAAGSFSTNNRTIGSAASPRAIDLGLSSTGNSVNDAAFYANSGVTVSNSVYVAAAGAGGVGLRTLGTESTSGTATFNNEIYLDGGLRLSAASGGTALFSGNIVNLGSLTKVGLGRVTLAGTNTATGDVTVSAGTLAITNGAAINGTSLVTVDSGATLDVLSSENIGRLTGGGMVNIRSSQTLTNNFSSASTTFSGTLTGSGDFAKTGDGTMTLSGNSSAYTGGVILNNGTFLAGNAGAFGTGTMTINYDGGTGTRTLASADATAYTLNNNFNLYYNAFTLGQTSGGTGSLTLGGAGKTFFLGNDAGANTRVITVNGNHAIAGQITGDNRLSKAGTGTLTLSAANTFSGGITVSDGTLRIGDNAALGTGGLTLDGGTLASDSGTARTLANSVTIGADVILGESSTGTGALTFSSAVGLGGSIRQLTVNQATTFSGAVTNGSLTKAGSAQLTLGNAGTSFSTLTVNSGTVSFSENGAITGLQGAGTVNIASTKTLTGTLATDFTFSGLLTGAGTLTKAGAGALNLSGASSDYTGVININAGVLEARHGSALGTSAGATTVASGAQLKIYNATGNITLADNFNISGTGVNGVGGAILSTGGNNTLSGTITLQSSSRIAADASGRATSSLSIGAVDASGGAYVIYFGASGADLSVTGTISGAGGSQDGTTTSIYKDGANVLTLTGGNTFTGDTRISAGKITVGSGGSLGTGSDVFIASGGSLEVNANTTVASVQEWGMNNAGTAALGTGATLTINGNNYTNYMNSISGAGSLTKSGTGIMNLYGTQSYTGTTTVSGGTLATATNMASTSFVVNGGTFSTDAANRLADTAAVSVSSGTFTIGGNDTVGSFTISGGTLGGSSILTASTYALQGGAINAALGAGTITVSGGTTTLGSAGRFNSSATLVINGGQLTLGGDESVAAFSGTGGTLALGANNLTVNSGTDSSFSGSLTGSGTLRTTGAGVLTLSGNNSSYTGATWISAGSLSITNANSLGSGALRLGSGNTLSTLVVSSNATIANRFEISDSASNAVVNVASGQTATVSGVLSQTNGTANATKFGKDGAGTLVFNNGSGTYNGQIQVGQGSIIVGATGALGVNTSTANRGIDLGLNVGDTSTANNVSVLASNGVTVGQSIYVAPNTSSATRTIGISGSGTATFNNEIYLGGDLIIDSAAGGNTVNVSGKITQNQGDAGVGIIKNSAGTATLSGASDYKGNTTINAGVLQISASNNLGAANNSVLIASGATLRSTANLTNTRAITISSGTGYVEASSGTTNTMSGTLTKDGTKLVLGGGGAHVVNGSIVGTSANSDLIISNSTTTINTANSYNGPTFIVAGGTLNNGINNALPTDTALTLGQAGETSGTTNTYNVSGYSQTVDSVATVGSGVNVVTNTTGTGNLTLNSSSAKSISNLTMGGANLTLTKAGANTVTLASGNNISASTIAIQQGTLLLGANNQIGNSTEINLAGGTLALGGNTDTVGRLTVSANSIFDFGTAGGSATTFTFSDFNTSAYGSNTYVMTVNNAAVGSAIVFNFNYEGNTTFNSFASKVQFGGANQFGQIQFGGGAGALGTTTLLVAIPDARVYTAAAFLLVLIGLTEYRRRRKTVSSKA